MNTRTPIQRSTSAAVLSLSFSASRNRFIAGLSDGIQVFRSDNCLTTSKPRLPKDGGVAIAAALDDRYIAYVAGGRTSGGSTNVVVFWDCLRNVSVTQLDFYEPVVGLRLNQRWMVVLLLDRAVVFEYQELPAEQRLSPQLDDDHEDARTETGDADPAPWRGPNRVRSIHPTSPNPAGVASLSNDLLVLPAQTTGQVHLVSLTGGSKRVLRAHNTALRTVALSPTGSTLATASEVGTLIRVYETNTLRQIAEFRRGVDKAIIHSMAFSARERWLAVTSDKGTVHVFEVHSAASLPVEGSSPPSREGKHHRSNYPNSISGALAGQDRNLLSGRSSPSNMTAAHQGSIQEYYGLRPPPPSASPASREPTVTAMSAFKSSALAPRIFKDVRSVANLPFHIGNDPPHWQGGVASSWTTAPDGTRKRVRNPVPALPTDQSGRPPKGIVAFAGTELGRNDDDGAVFYVLGGGIDSRWQMFELVPIDGGKWGLANRGFRKYMTRQFADD